MGTTGGERIFVDTNVLVYAAVRAAPLHATARETLRSLRDEAQELWISRQVIREYLAVLSRPQTFSKPVPTSLLAEDAQRFQKVFSVAGDDAEVTRVLLDLIKRVPVAGRQIHDANIVATMLAREIGRVLTHNIDDFQRFSPWVTVMPL